MAPKRKSDAIELDIPAQGTSQQLDDALGRGKPDTEAQPPAKKARSKKDAAAPATGRTWQDIKLEGEDEVSLRVATPHIQFHPSGNGETDNNSFRTVVFQSSEIFVHKCAYILAFER